MDYAQIVGCPFVHPMAGVRGEPDIYLGNIDWALGLCEGTGLRLLVEAITVPGYHIGTLARACALQDTFPAVVLLFDSYHARVLGEDPAHWVRSHATRIGHVHIADHPGRHEPGSGTIDFDALLTALCDGGYAADIGFEFIPSTLTSASTGFVPGWAARLSRKVTT